MEEQELGGEPKLTSVLPAQDAKQLTISDVLATELGHVAGHHVVSPFDVLGLILASSVPVS